MSTKNPNQLKCYEPQIGFVNLAPETLAQLADMFAVQNVDKEYYCNTETGTKWVKVCVYTKLDDGSIEETILREEDTGFSCIEATVFEEHFCVAN